MPKKGETNNPAGRTVGSKNRRTIEWESFGKDFLADTMPLFSETITKWMESGDTDLQYKAMSLTTDVIEYFKPKLSRAQLSGAEDAPPLIIKINGSI